MYFEVTKLVTVIILVNKRLSEEKILVSIFRDRINQVEIISNEISLWKNCVPLLFEVSKRVQRVYPFLRIVTRRPEVFFQKGLDCFLFQNNQWNRLVRDRERERERERDRREGKEEALERKFSLRGDARPPCVPHRKTFRRGVLTSCQRGDQRLRANERREDGTL